MSLAKHSSRFADVKEIFDGALSNNGAKITAETLGKAIRWRQRAYHFRKVLWGELNADNPVPPVPTPYDSLTIRVEHNVCFVDIQTPDSMGLVVEYNTPKFDLEVEALRQSLGIII
jgi:hypothetical protein